MNTIRKAVLPVAGLGTRVLPATKAVPKEMLPIVDRPAIQYVVAEAREAGIEHFVLVTGRNKGAIEDYFDRAYELETSLREKNKDHILDELHAALPPAGSMSFVRQQAPLGLGHAVWCAREVIGDEAFAVLLPDVLVRAEPSCLAQMVASYNNHPGANIIAVETVPEEDIQNLGVIDPGSRQGAEIDIRGMVEKPAPSEAPSNLAITGRYILQPQVFRVLENLERGSGGELQLTDAMHALMTDTPFVALEYDGKSYDCGSKLGYFRAIVSYAMEHREIGDEAKQFLNSLDL